MPNLFQRKNAVRGRMVYRATGKLARPLAFLLRYLFWVLVGIAILSVICMLILTLVRTSVDHLLLSPYLQAETGANGNTVYHVNYGGGVEATIAEDRVTLSAAKTALYAGLAQICLSCLVLAPICRFVSILLHNLAQGNYGDKKNPDMICFSALTLLVGSPIFSIVSGYFRYLLQKAFAGPGMLIRFVFDPDWFGIGAALLLLLAGFVYGCENHRLSAELPCAQDNNRD